MQVTVLGMHRSGTSVVARLLNMMGMYFAPEDKGMPPTEDNPKGYWERMDVVQLNEGILANLGSTWERVSQFDLTKVSDELHAEFNRQATDIIYNLDANRPWMLKDPRLCLTFPLWRKLLEVPVCIMVYRSPIQIAQSMHNRDKFSMQFGMALWEFYNIHALQSSLNLPRILISYHDLMANPLETTKKLYQDLESLDITGIRLPSDKEILAFVEPKLFRATAGGDLQKSYINQNQTELVNAFENGTILEWQELPSVSQGAIDALQEHDAQFFEREQHKQELAQQQAVMQSQLAEQQAELEKLSQQLTQLRNEVVEQDKAISQTTQQLNTVEQQKAGLTQELHAARQQESYYEQQIQQINQDLELERIAVEEKDVALADLDRLSLRQYEKIHKLTNWLEVLNHDVNAVFNSRTWQTGDNITKLALRLMMKPEGKTAKDHIKQVMDGFMDWRIKQLSDDERLDSPEALDRDKKKINVAALVALHNGEPSASASIRLILPLEHPSVSEFIHFKVYTAWEYLLSIAADVIIVQRHMLPNENAAKRLTEHCRKQNIKLVYETDDDLYNIFKKPDMHGNYAKDAVDALEVVTRDADLVVASSPKLQQQIREMNQNTLCVPNSLDEQIWLAQDNGQFVQPRPQSSDGKIHILYMGTKTHTEDLMLVKAAYQKIKAEYGEKVSLDVIGGVPDGMQIFADNLISKATDSNLDDYPTFVQWMRDNNHWHFGIIPLTNNNFNEKKTYIKFLDYAALGVPAICSDIDPYNEIVRDGENGLIVKNNTDAWYQAIKRMIDQVELREQLAANAFQTLVDKHILHHTAKDFAEPYKKLLNWQPPKPEVVATAQPNHDDYHKWLRLYDPLDRKTLQNMKKRVETWQNPPLISILMPTYNTKEKWLKAAIQSVQKQVYGNWELCIADDASTDENTKRLLKQYQQQDERIKVVFREQNGHISAASNSALELVTGDYVALLDHDDELAPHALYWVVEELLAYPDAQMIYSDEDKIDEKNHRFGAYFKSDWNPDLFLSHNLVTHLAVYKTELLQQIGGFTEGLEGAQDYDLAIRAAEQLESEQIRHIPRILYHWRIHEESTSGNPDAKPYAVVAAENAIRAFLKRQSIAANVNESEIMSGMIRVQYPLPAILPLVSIIIPTYNQVQLLRQCIQSITRKTDYANYEIIVVDNRSDDAATLAYFEELEQKNIAKVIKYDQPFNYAAINNFAVKQAEGELVALLNNDIEVISRSWLSEMVSHAMREDIGAVGARLWYPHQTLQHAGVLLGVAGLAEHAHKNVSRGQSGYFGRAQIIQNFSAVTAACLVVCKEKFVAVGGLDADHLAVAFNDIDLCLKLTSKGWRSLWTPYADLYHHESASRGYEDTPEKVARLQREDAYMREKWGDWIANDPAYSPNLNHKTGDFSLAFPPHNLSDKPMFSMKLPNFLRRSQPDESAAPPASPIAHRADAYQLLNGRGLEIGALHEPAEVPEHCEMEYCDANSRADLMAMFPELHGQEIVDPQHICNVDERGLEIFKDNTYDFVVFNHVIEHIANPINMVGELFRVVKVGGLVVLSAPDKDFTYDKPRPLTTFEHLLEEYEQGVTEISDEHYIDFIRHVEPSWYQSPAEEFQHYLARVKLRREHAHVWNAESFEDFLQRTFELFDMQPKCVYKHKENGYEYFSIWEKTAE
ncbi:glycosyltransferase [Candidatus Albibeggiatoa sp. nov. NOAA]|uniref:glycosyltransferase n=1 Tax=Candidatus Albibeggiatoa sp. nov. NOAA TaxID=3162724 RepID=UPI0032F4620B|nr:glycosyltransferase [Thiotrichaceae bacterium]